MSSARFFDNSSACWHRVKKVGFSLEIMVCQRPRLAGFRLTSFTARSNSFNTDWHGRLFIWGSNGPRQDCLPIIIDLHDTATMDPADIAIWGIMARMSPLNIERRYLIICSVAEISPPGVCRIKSSPLDLSSLWTVSIKALMSRSLIVASRTFLFIKAEKYRMVFLPVWADKSLRYFFFWSTRNKTPPFGFCGVIKDCDLFFISLQLGILYNIKVDVWVPDVHCTSFSKAEYCWYIPSFMGHSLLTYSEG